MNDIELIEPSVGYADDIWTFRDEIIKQDAENEEETLSLVEKVFHI